MKKINNKKPELKNGMVITPDSGGYWYYNPWLAEKKIAFTQEEMTCSPDSEGYWFPSGEMNA